MTTNQLRYQEHLEQKRHNVATETETSRSNLEKEKIQRDYNVWFSGETTRHNLAQEEQARQTLIVNDAHYQRQDYEQQRHNTVTEQLQLSQQLEAVRHNKEVETETKRHNTVSEAQTWQELAIDKIEAKARERQAIASMITAKASRTRAETEKEELAHTKQMDKAKFTRDSIWHEQQVDIEQQKADATTYQAVSSRIQAEAASTQAGAAQWNSITQSALADYQIDQIKSQTSLNNAKTEQVEVNTTLGIFDTVKSTVKDALNLIKKNKKPILRTIGGLKK